MLLIIFFLFFLFFFFWFSKLINNTFEDEVPLSKLNMKPKNTYQINENHDLCIKAAINIGCSVVNIGGKDLEAGVPHLVMGLLWQIIKVSKIFLYYFKSFIFNT